MDKKPKWQKEIESFKGIKSTFIIEGNINDLYPDYIEEGKANYINLDFLLMKLLKIDDKLEYDFVFCNPVLGFYSSRLNIDVANILKDFDKSNNSIFRGEKKENYKVSDVEEFSLIVKDVMTNKLVDNTKREKPIAVVINFAARFISSPTSLDTCENNMFINLFEA